MNRQNFGFYLDLGADLTEDLYAGVLLVQKNIVILVAVSPGKRQQGSKQWMIN